MTPRTKSSNPKIARAQELKSGFTRAELAALTEPELDLLVGALEAIAVAQGTAASIRELASSRANPFWLNLASQVEMTEAAAAHGITGATGNGRTFVEVAKDLHEADPLGRWRAAGRSFPEGFLTRGES